MKAACPSVCLLGSALDVCGWCVVSEKRGVTSSPEYHWRSVLCIMLIAGGGGSESEGVIVVVCIVVGDEGCEVVIVVYVKDGGRVK